MKTSEALGKLAELMNKINSADDKQIADFIEEHAPIEAGEEPE